MDDALTIAQTWGPTLLALASAAAAVGVALRKHAESSAGTIKQLQTWLREAQTEIKALRDEVENLKAHRDRLAEEVERLLPYQHRAASLAAELRARQAEALGVARPEGRTTYREPGGPADVVQLHPTAATRDD